MSLGMSKDRIFLGYDIVNNTFFARQPRVVVDPASTHSHRTPVVLASSRFIARKNLPLLIRAFARAQERVPVKWNLILLGDGPQREALSTLITTLNLTGTVFLPGFMNSAECRRHYHEADVFVHPATTEQWGLVVNEAMAAQLPVIVSRTCGCVPELVEDGTTGFTFSPTDEDTLVAALTKVMSNAPLRATLGRNALQRVSTVCGPDTFGKAAADAALLAVARTHTTR
jgi:glycosyltransferase involved in cell wall biosynthesis